MCVIKNRMVLIKIIALFTINIKAVEIKTSELSIGDIVNINYLNPKSTETYGNIFDGINTASFIEIKDSSGGKQISIEKEVCLSFKALESYYYPEIKIDDRSLEKSSKIYNYTNRGSLFHINPYYINEKYSFGVIKVCRMVKIHQLFSQVINQADLPIVSDSINYKLLLDKTAVLRFGQEDKSHYVSSISTGECIVQAYAISAEWCNQNNNLKDDIKKEHFFNSYLYRSAVKIVGGDPDRENQMNSYMNVFGMQLVHLSNVTIMKSWSKSFYYKFKSIEKPNVIELDLKSLPRLPEKLPSLMITKQKFVIDIVPGDIIDLNDFKQIHSFITVDNLLVDVSDGRTPPFTNFDYTDCRKFSKDDAVKIEYSTYKFHSNHFTEYFYKFDLFDEMIRRRNYGVDPKYLNNRYKCLKVKICSEFERTKLIIPSVYVVNLDKDDVDKLRFFDSKNVVLRYKLGNETHYVARTEKGNCLFQALIYENLDDSSRKQQIQSPLLFRGKILSAYNDENFEGWAEKFVTNLPVDGHKTLMSLINNQTAKAAIINKFSHEYYSDGIINIYLDSLN